MASKKREEVFQLIKSLEKAEKRNFKRYVTRNSANQDLKIIQLFDLLDKMSTYDESLLLKEGTGLRKAQLSNLKAHLYKQVLASLRIIRDEHNIENALHEQLEYARILYSRGLHLHSLKILQRIKDIARTYHQGTFLLQILIFERKIESLHITRSLQNRAQILTEEIDLQTRQLSLISSISNLSLLLYGRYIVQGHARNQIEVAATQQYFKLHLPIQADQDKSFYGRMYLYQANVWYAYICQDFLQYYRYAQRWYNLFEAEPQMKQVEGMYFLKSLHHLLQAHYLNRKEQKFIETLRLLESTLTQPKASFPPNQAIQANIYVGLARLDQHFYQGRFSDGLPLVPELERFLQTHEGKMDPHQVLLFYYKIACLYFGAGRYSETIDYLTRIINWQWNLRDDLQCYARLLHLITHYELGNFDILDAIAKSAYRYLAKMENLSLVEEEIFRFIRQAFHRLPEELPDILAQLLATLKQLELQAESRRAFQYLDFVSWLESKLQQRPVQDIIREKYLKRRALKD